MERSSDHYRLSADFVVRFTVMQAVSAAWTPRRTVWRRFCAFWTRISSEDLHPGVTALTLRGDKTQTNYYFIKPLSLSQPKSSDLEMMLSWLVMVRICSTMRDSSTVHCLSRQWLVITLIN